MKVKSFIYKFCVALQYIFCLVFSKQIGMYKDVCEYFVFDTNVKK
jgi:hypothetical protein